MNCRFGSHCSSGNSTSLFLIVLCQAEVPISRTTVNTIVADPASLEARATAQVQRDGRGEQESKASRQHVTMWHCDKLKIRRTIEKEGRRSESRRYDGVKNTRGVTSEKG